MTVCKRERSSTQFMRNRCFSSLGVEHLLPLHLPRGSSPVELIFSFSQGDGGTELCCFNFGFTTLHFQMISFTGTSCLYGRTFLSRFVSCPLKNPAGITGNEPHDKDTKLEFCFLALQYDFTSYSAYRCIS